MVLSLERWVGKVAIVTGASSGIGAAIAERLVEEGLKVVGLARRKDRLDELANKLSGKKGKLYPIQADIIKEDDILNAFKWVKANLGPVYVLINNAGVAKIGNFDEGDTATWENILRVNVLGLCIATREAVKDMKSNNIDGHIIHINSIVGHQVPNFPGLNIYTASKFAVRALAETLRLELNASKSKIKITSLSPSGVKTEMISQAMEQEEYAAKIFDEVIKEGRILNPEDLADAVSYILSTPPHVQIQELTLRAVNEPF